MASNAGRTIWATSGMSHTRLYSSPSSMKMTTNLECYRRNYQSPNEINSSNLNSVFEEEDGLPEHVAHGKEEAVVGCCIAVGLGPQSRCHDKPGNHDFKKRVSCEPSHMLIGRSGG